MTLFNNVVEIFILSNLNFRERTFIIALIAPVLKPLLSIVITTGLHLLESL